ncbi:Matrixin family protein [Hibiscus syriacus]|uniref:Matrixin family protein n=1 Tax=Hibiscus syriacus TaxID=106335 RepID=A0A6A3AKU3_HIBSY|nr:Matrixin family protein [Hibiscus syriacus]
MLLGLKFDKSQLKTYRTPEELHNLFVRGSSSGGISAAIDEIPYIKLFIAKYCGKYTTVEPTFKTGGFGFVFPKGSPLVEDTSREILNVTQGDQMEKFQKKWLENDEVICPGFDPGVSSNSLGLESFWGLFLIAGLASISALIIFAAIKTEPRDASSSNTNCPPSPSSLSNQTDASDFVFIVELGSNASSPDISVSGKIFYLTC